MKKILLDTNFLLIPSQFGVDIFTELNRICYFNYRLFVLDKTVKELKDIVETQKGKHRDAARIAMQLLKLKKVGIVKTNSDRHTDDLILDYAKTGYLVATQDKDLKRRLINHGIEVIVLKRKKILALANDKGFE
jgi:uncharacterized protein